MAFKENITELVERETNNVTKIHNSWQRVALSKIANVINGYAFKSNQFSTTKGIPLIRIRDVLKGFSQTFYDGNVPDGYWVDSGDILIGMDGDFNICRWKSEKALLNQRVCKIDVKVDDYYDKRFLFYCLPVYLKLIHEHTSATTVKHLSSKTISDLPVPLPPLNEQTRIANKLDSILAKVDAAQARLDKVPNILKRFRQSVLAAATSGELTKEWRDSLIGKLTNDFKNHSITTYEERELAALPTSWCYVHFKDAAIIKSNLVDPKLTPNAIHLAPNHIESNTGKVSNTKTVEEDNVKSNKHKFYSGQIVYSKIRPYLNKVCLVDFDGLCSADMYPIESKIKTSYLHLYMLSESFVHWTSQKQGRVVLPKINQKALNEIPVPIPSQLEQDEIVRRVDSLLNSASAFEWQYTLAIKKISRLSQAILKKAFQGELIPQNPADEPAEKLLSRIQSELKKQPKPNTKRATAKKAVVKNMNLEDAPANYLKNLMPSDESEIKAKQLWQDSKMTIDDFYAQLKKELINIKEINESLDPDARTLKTLKE